MEELLSLKWNNHRSTFIHVLGVLRQKQMFTDATLACEEKFYNVHKLVLSTCSEYFSAILDRTYCKNPVIVLKDIKCNELEALLDYMYLGEVNIRQSELATLIKAAESLRVKGLAISDDEPPSLQKARVSVDSQSRRGNRDSSSPPAKRKRPCSPDNNIDAVKPAEPDTLSPVLDLSCADGGNISTSPSNNGTKAPLSPNRSAPLEHSETLSSSDQLDDSSGQQQSKKRGTADCVSDTQAENLVKEEIQEDDNDVDTYNFNDDEVSVKEEDNPSRREVDSGGSLHNNLPIFMSRALFAAPSSFQPEEGEISNWEGDGSSLSYHHLDFVSNDGSSSQQDTGVMSYHQSPGYTTNSTIPTTTRLCPSAKSTGYSCEYCGRWFEYPSLLLQHVRVHTGERPFPCHLCDHKSKHKADLKKHVVMKHGVKSLQH